MPARHVAHLRRERLERDATLARRGRDDEPVVRAEHEPRDAGEGFATIRSGRRLGDLDDRHLALAEHDRVERRVVGEDLARHEGGPLAAAHEQPAIPLGTDAPRERAELPPAELEHHPEADEIEATQRDVPRDRGDLVTGVERHHDRLVPRAPQGRRQIPEPQVLLDLRPHEPDAHAVLLP